MSIKEIKQFTSTGYKLIHHPSVVMGIQSNRFGVPVTVQVAPTSRCNLNCSFCSNANRELHEDLDYVDLIRILFRLKDIRGMESIEITGGGDPTLYYRINELIEVMHLKGTRVAMITNGVQLMDKVTIQNINRLTWLRISMNCLDYLDDIKLPETRIRGTLGFSYVWNEKTKIETIHKIAAYAKKYKAQYVRVVPDCNATIEEQERNNRILSQKVMTFGPPFFYQPKDFIKPLLCYWCYFKPFILHDGYVYPCSSVVLNSTSDKTFHEKFRWCEMNELPNKYSFPMNAFSTENCDHCVFSEQNQMIMDIISRNDQRLFI